MHRCHYCKKIIDEISYNCHKCNYIFCSDCRLPENHNCPHRDKPKPHYTFKQKETKKPMAYKKIRFKNTWDLIKTIVLSIIILIVAGIIAYALVISSFSAFIDTHNPFADSIKPILNLPTETTIEQSKTNLKYINSIRAGYSRSPLNFDIRLYNLAKARTNDLEKYGYFDHTNPVTGTCPYTMKAEYGFSSNEYVAENLYESKISVNNGNYQYSAYHEGMENEAVDSWLTSRGHRYNLLFDKNLAGVVYCSSNSNCVFLGLNHDQFGLGCHTGTEGMTFWYGAGKQPEEI